MKILVTGGTGFLGQQLVEQLLIENHDLLLVTRQNPSKFVPFPGQILTWPIAEEDHKKLTDVDAVIHLAGEPVGDGRWTKEKKTKIYDSRVQGTKEIVDLMRLMPKVHTFISASGIGFYGDNKNDELDESSPNGTGFLAEVCRDWEAEAFGAERPGLRVCVLRTGVALGRNGGVLKKLEPFFRNNMGGPAGEGSQQMSWIHERDWVRATLYCLHKTAISGVVNLTSPEPISNKSFSIELARLFRQNMIIHVPAFALQIAYGDMSSLALDGQRVLPKKLLEHGFKFEFAELDKAMKHLYDLDEENPMPDEFYATSQWVPTSVEKTFAFFADEKHLEKIIQEDLQFKVTGKNTMAIGPGTFINYEMNLHGFQIHWQSLIKIWDPPYLFADEQHKGPYSRWYHEHTFTPACGGTLIRDKVLFRIPGGAIGRLSGKWIVDSDIEVTFSHRRKMIAKIFSE